MINGGIIIGALIGALLSGDFRFRWPHQKSIYLRILGGGLIMGYGAGLASGCNVSAFFSAVPSLGLNGFIFGASVFLGSLVGIQLLKNMG
jgi:uncharacterized membrane protein YedE/YeeE